MKKIKIILTLLALLPISRTFAQVGEIIYRDFEPDSVIIAWIKLGPVWIDLDADGEADDLKMQMHTSGSICYPEFLVPNSNIKICPLESNETDIILSEVEEEKWTNYVGWAGPSGCDAAYYNYYGFRIQREDGYYYGWFEKCHKPMKAKNEKRLVQICFDRTAYCTIPNYPLRWGQTSLTDGIGEMETTASKLHPNPTKGTVRIEGENAAEVQVFNALGQLLKTVQNANEVSLEGLPQGVYVLRVTLEGGKVFSDKVVKE